MVVNTALDGASTAYEVAETSGEDDALRLHLGTLGWPMASHERACSAGVAAVVRATVVVTEVLFTPNRRPRLADGCNQHTRSWFWGASLFTYEGEFDTDEWAALLDEYPISVLFSVPTAYRMLREERSVFPDVNLRRPACALDRRTHQSARVEW